VSTLAPPATRRAASAAPTDLEVPRVLPVRSLSHSSLARWERCPEQWRAHYLLGEREPQRLNMTAGKALGGALAAFFKARMNGAQMSASDADDRLLAEFGTELRHTVLEPKHKPEVVREQCREPLRHYLETVAPGIHPVAVEREARARFPGAEWTFVGYIDLETDGGDVVDYKLGERHVDRRRPTTDPQPRAYMLLRLLEGEPAKRFVFHSLRRGKIGEDADRFRPMPVEFTPLQLDNFQRRVARVAREIARAVESGDFATSTQGWWCGERCPHFARCPAGGLR
jgi:hypothetical protein